MRILVYHNGALGDFVATVPALRLLRSEFPHARLALLGRPSLGELARAFGLIDETVDAGSPLLASLYRGTLGPEARGLLQSFDEALLFTQSEPLIRACRELVPRVADQAPFPSTTVSVYLYHAAFAARALEVRAGSTPAGDPVTRALEAPLLPIGAPRRQPLAVIHPGSGSPIKTWPILRYAEVATALRERGLSVLWSTGPADAGARKAVEKRSLAGESILEGATPLELARRLATASVYLGSDSGVAHLAAAVRCPSIILFGPTSPEVWRPPGEHVHILVRREPCRSAPDPPCAIPPHGTRCERTEGGIARCLLAIEPLDVLSIASGLSAAPPCSELASGDPER